jgi:pimeloyl-ACP methyl ester carboxylesterase
MRFYGIPPYRVVVLHGGPGAPGYMAPVAKELATQWGVLEPMQSTDSVDGQVEELKDALLAHSEPPVSLIGSSWGAMLGFLFSAKYPHLVKQLIMIGSAVFEESYAKTIDETRLNRLTDEEKQRVEILLADLNDPNCPDKNIPFAELGTLFSKTDAYDPLSLENEVIEHQYHVFQSVWSEFQTFRSQGRLLELGRRIECPVIAIHGDYDSHPAEGVQKPLSQVLKQFEFILLPKCGHLPWTERQAKDTFYATLRKILA